MKQHRGLSIGVVIVVVVVVAVGVGKLVAERSADSDTAVRARQITEMLDGATPRDFLAFNAGVKEPGSVASRVSKEAGFVSVKAVADSSFIRFQPSGWWSGFTERCIVAVVTKDDVAVRVPKVACVRVDTPGAR